MRHTILLVLCTFAAAAHGSENDALARLIQPDFRALSQGLGAALSYRGSVHARQSLAAQQLGGGFAGPQFNSELSATQAVFRSDWFDIGGFHSALPRTSISLTALDLKFRVVEGGAHRPSFDLGGSMARLDGTERLEFNSRGLDLTISQGFSLATPYAGIGRVWVDSRPDQGLALESEHFFMDKYFIGARFELGLADVALEADRTGSDTTIGARFGLRF